MGQHKPFLMPGEDDISHELKPDGILPTATKKPPRPRRPKPTAPPLAPEEEVNYVNGVDKSWTPLLSTTLVSDQEQVFMRSNTEDIFLDS